MFFAAGQFGVFLPSRWCLFSYPNKVLVYKKKHTFTFYENLSHPPSIRASAVWRCLASGDKLISVIQRFLTLTYDLRLALYALRLTAWLKPYGEL